MKIHYILMALGVAGAIGLPSAALAQSYKWRDEKGQIIYSDQPPPARIPPGNILQAPKRVPSPVAAPVGAASAGAGTGAAPAAKSAPSAPLSTAEREAEFKKRKLEAEKKAKEEGEKTAQEQQRASVCAALQRSLTSLESGQRLSRIDSKGERYFVDDAERARDIAKARADMTAAKCS